MNSEERAVAAVLLTKEGSDFIGDVEEFHRKFQLAYEGKPRMLPEDLFDFRQKFHLEEITEYGDEQFVLSDIARRLDVELHEDHIITALDKQLDALVDATYVILGTAQLQFGAEVFRKAWARVHAANMAKVRAISSTSQHTDSGREPTYDVVKPPGWTAPCHRDLVSDHEPLPGYECEDEGCPHYGAPHGHDASSVVVKA